MWREWSHVVVTVASVAQLPSEGLDHCYCNYILATRDHPNHWLFMPADKPDAPDTKDPPPALVTKLPVYFFLHHS